MLWLAFLLLSLPPFVLLFLPWMKKPKTEPSTAATNHQQLLSNRLDELRIEYLAGTIEEETYQTMQEEAKKIFSDSESESIVETEDNKKTYFFPAIALLLISLVASTMIYINTSDGYLTLLEMDKINNNIEQLLDHIQSLEAQLEKEPNDNNRWKLLADAHLVLGQYAAAVAAYAQLEKLEDQITDDVVLDYAKALILSETIGPKAEQLLKQILARDPTNDEALFLYGVLKFNRSEYRQAVKRWEELYNNDEVALPEDMRQMLVDMIEETQQRMQTEAAAPASSSRQIQVTISLDPNIKTQVSAEEVVFVYARAVDGPPMPLAAKRIVVSKFPLTVNLNENDTMMQGMSLTNFETVTIFARIAKSGLAQQDTGDLIGSEVIELSDGVTKASVLINTIVE